MTNEMFNIYLMDVMVTKAHYPSWRTGQTYFNVLRNHAPEIADEIRGKEYDPFFSDGRIPGFLYFLHSEYVKD